MKKRFLTLVVSIIAMLTCVFGLVACNKDGNSGNSSSGKGRVPVYQGMTISNGQSTVLTANKMSIGLMSAKTPGNTDNNGNHNGWHKGDYEGKDEDIDQENPFPENESNENIENEIESTLDVIGAGQEIYYAMANEDIYINIHISNPDNYEIMSFTLNGKKYSSYMFEEGSDMETLVLKYNVGSESGIQEYTIDAIKYIDGTDIKDVIMDGDKTVLAGVRIENQVNATISNATIQTNALSFNVKINDNDNLISYSQGCLKAVVYDGESVVATKDLTVGDNNVFFDNLATSTLYQYAIVGYYDDLSGEGFAMNTLYKEAFYTKAIVLFDDIVVSQESIEFSFVWDSDFQNKTLTALKLYKGNTLTELSATATAVNNLLSNTIYTLIAEYKNGEKTENISLEFKTEAKAVPVVEIASPTKTQTSVGFAINETDTDNVGAVTKIELIHANGTVVADSLDVREFTGLLSNNTYTVKVTYAYDLNDGVGSQKIVKTLDIKTEAKAVPVVEIANPTKTDTTISVEHTFTDIDNVGKINSVKIYKGETPIAENTDKEIVFTNLEYYTEYKIVIAYSYDLNDGDGVHNQVFETTCKTNPHLVFNSCKIINTSAVSEGETIYMQAMLDNPSGALPSSVVVNGQVYNCTGSTTASKIYIEIVNNGQFEGGNTTLFIEEINMTLDGATYTVKTDSNNSGTVFINGALSVESLKLVNKGSEIVDYCMPGDEMYLLLTLKNKTGYTIDSVTINGSTITTLIKIDDEHYRIDRTLSNGWNYSSITSITYHNAYINKTLSIGNCTTNRVYKTNTSTITEISTVEQLMNTKYNGGYYKLTADIDLSGIEWTNLGTFNGVFDGNGYKILNMSNVSTIVDKDAHIGLFYSGSGVFLNASIEEMTILLTQTTSNGGSYGANIGAFVSDGGNLTFNNCYVSCDISVINKTNIDWSGLFYGVAAFYGYEGGFTDFACFNSCVTDANISIQNASGQKLGYVGGLIGRLCLGNIYISNCNVTGDFTGAYCDVLVGATFTNSEINYKNNKCDAFVNNRKVEILNDYYHYEND